MNESKQILCAPLSGVPLPLDQMSDLIISNRIIGDGVCIESASRMLCAPMAGIVSVLQENGCFISLTGDTGIRVLIHIGVGSTELASNCFNRLVEEGQRVEAGCALIERYADDAVSKPYSMLTVMLVVSGEQFISLAPQTSWIESGQALLSVSLPEKIIDGSTPPEGEALFSKPVKIINRNGLQVLPAVILVQTAKSFVASIYLHKQQDSANAKSLSSIMAMQLAFGDLVQVSASGPEAELAIKTLAQLLAARCGDQIPKDNYETMVEALDIKSLHVMLDACEWTAPQIAA